MSGSVVVPRCIGAACIALLTASLTTVGPAQASPVFNNAETSLDPLLRVASYQYGASACGNTSTPSGSPTPVQENGPQVTSSTTPSANYTNAGNAGDTATATGVAKARGKVASAKGVPSSMDFAVTASSAFNNALGIANDCARHFAVGSQLSFEFTLTKPSFLSVHATNEGETYGEVYISKRGPNDVDTYVDLYAQGLNFTSDVKVFLPAGTYGGYFEGKVSRTSFASYTSKGKVTAHGDFTVAGSRTSKVSGKGKRYLTMPKSRSCAAHSLYPRITSNKQRARTIKQIQFFVNGKKAKQVSTPDRGDKVKLNIGDNVAARVRAVVRTKAKGSKPRAVTATYEACSSPGAASPAGRRHR